MVAAFGCRGHKPRLLSADRAAIFVSRSVCLLANGKAEEELEELAESLQLPSEVLALREGSEPSPELSVYTRVMLRGGTLFGPYAAHLVKDPGQAVSATHITIQSKEGSTTYLKLKEAAGSWLKTLRLVKEKGSANANLSLEGDEVWCSLTRDVAADTELLAHFTTSPQNKQMLPSIESTADADAFVDDIDVVVDDTDNVESTSSAAEELKNGVRSPPTAVSSSPVPTLSNGPEVQVAADDEQKASDSAENNSTHAEKVQSPSEVTVQSSEIMHVQVKVEACSPVGIPSGPSSEDLPSDDPDADSRATKNDQLATVASKKTDLHPERINGYSPLAGTSTTMLLQQPSIVVQQGKFSLVMSSFECGMCGIQFSSGKTLKAHQVYYCSQRVEKATFMSARSQTEVTEDCLPPVSPSHRSSPRENGEGGAETSAVPAKRPRREDGLSPPSSDASSTTSKSPKNSRTYQCKYCSYAYDRKGSLTRHMRLHGSPSSPTNTADVPPAASTEDISIPPSARYCANCDIQFSSYKTFTVHKQFYCGTRHVQKAPVSIAPAPPSVPTVSIAPAAPEQVLLNQPLFAAISTNPLILVPCSYVPGNGLVPTTGGVLRQDTAPSVASAIVCPQTVAVAPAALVTSSGSVTPVASAPAEPSETKENGTQAKDASSEGTAASAASNSSKANSPCIKQEHVTETPLDLSLRKEAKARQSPRNPSSPGPSQQEETSNPSAIVVSTIDPLLTLGEQVVVKQGTSRCRECNIVFYKHENYLAHKRHYCASRQQKLGRLSSPSGDEGSSSELVSRSPSANASASPVPAIPDVFGQRSAGVQSPPQPLYQFYCLACGIKFTSLSNLQAHQTYYCPKRDVLKGQVGVAAVKRPAEFSCVRCRLSYPTEEALKQHLCSAALRKCPYCDVFCPTQIAAQRHLVTHTGVRAFRCADCGYKGHTLRGMRTHVRMHLEKGTQMQEEALILCVGADGNTLCPWNGTAGVPAAVTPALPHASETTEEASARSGSPPTATTVTEESSSTSRTCEEHHPAPSELLHWCNLCGYSSSYKGNVVRHVKLVHRDVVATSAVHSFTSEKARSSANEGHHSPMPEVKVEEVSDAEDAAAETLAKQQSDVTVCNSPTTAEATLVEVVATNSADTDASAAMKPVPPVPTPKSKLHGGTKYCKACDISFNYLSTFVAHKKYYCTAQTSDSADSSGTVAELGDAAPGTA
ncbi:hypothetical protein HPB50_000445 [Hyalomma asiaticum]|uniref:Uncharacterized protein n=1 Tax=Hyalomma asiaticum TaxID=266040 RepID=A0ACB7T9Q2_HYAAI|nr:hypothetical protein HPB50_000445 [Hyalomma asiaticum]